VSHSGATAGYRAYLADYPDEKVSVAVLCNVSTGNATEYAHAVADVYLGPRAQTAADRPNGESPQSANGTAMSGDDPIAGLYRQSDTGEPVTFTRMGQELRAEGGAPLAAHSPTRYVRTSGQTYDFAADGRLTVTDEFGTVQTFARVPPGELAPKPPADYVGEYHSEEAEASMTAALDGGALVLRRRPDAVLRLTSVYADAFRAPIGFVRFHRDAAGKVTGFSVTQDRVWDLRFVRK
jgi:hypothetical protein